jgi:hypothetical protein
MATSVQVPTESTQSVRERIKGWCQENGYRTGHYGNCRHQCGLPRIESVWVRPDWSPVDGDHVLLVTADRVIQAVCPYPWGDNDWQTRATYAYSTPEELKSILDRLVKPPQGCWR